MTYPKLGQISASGAPITLSGTRVVTVSVADHVYEHEVPGREGGLVERVGSQRYRVKAQGFFESGDAMKQAVLPLVNTAQFFSVPSTASGSYVFSGFVHIDEFTMGQEAGRGYPYYSWVLSMTASSGIYELAHILLDGNVNSDTYSGGVSKGDLVYGSSGVLWSKLAVGTDGQAVVAQSGLPFWGLVGLSGVANTIISGGGVPYTRIPTDNNSVQQSTMSGGVIAQKNGYIAAWVSGADVTAVNTTAQAIVMDIPPSAHGFALHAAINVESNRANAATNYIGIQTQSFGVTPALEYAWAVTTVAELTPAATNPSAYVSQAHNSDLIVLDPVDTTKFGGTAVLNGFLAGGTSSGQLAVYLISSNAGNSIKAKQNSTLYAMW